MKISYEVATKLLFGCTRTTWNFFHSTMIDSSELHSLICQLSEKLPNKSTRVRQQWKSAWKFVQSLNFKWDPSWKIRYESWNFIKTASNRAHSASLYSGKSEYNNNKISPESTAQGIPATMNSIELYWYYCVCLDGLKLRREILNRDGLN